VVFFDVKSFRDTIRLVTETCKKGAFMQTIELLSCQLDNTILGHVDFDQSVLDGVEGYVDDSAADLDEVRAFVQWQVCRRFNPAEAVYGVSSLPCRVGFCLGWLSTLACTRSDLALSGLDLLSSLAQTQYYVEIQHGCNPLVAVPGVCQSR
jgi:hypothetical protein